MGTMQVSGDVLIACNCDWGCPCNFNARPSRGFCQGGWIWQIERGPSGRRRLWRVSAWRSSPSGPARSTRAAAARSPTSTIAPTPPSATALTRLVSGECGGPWGIFAKTYALAPPVFAPFHVAIDGRRSRAAIGEVGVLELQTIRNPVTQAEAHPEIVLPEGLVVKRGGLGASSVFRLKDGIDFDHSGQYAAFGRFDYA